MEKNTSEDEILLVHDLQEKTIKAVKGIDKEGNLQTVPPKKEHHNQFLKINKQADPLENFLSNFKRQLKDSTRFLFFNTRWQVVETAAKNLEQAIRQNNKDQRRYEAAHNNPQKQKSMETQASTEQKPFRFDPEKINWENLGKFGITEEKLQQNTLETMLKGGKSQDLHHISANFGTITLQTDARLSFRNMPDGSVALAIHGVRHQPELDRPFFGHHFSEQDKQNLLETGNMGRLAETKNFRTGEANLVYISVDKLTNELVAMKAEYIRLPERIKGVQLSEEQKQALHEGKAVFVEGMTAKSGKEFSAYIQINADKRGLEFRFDNGNKQNQSQNQDNQVFIPQKLGGVELSKEQQNGLQEGKTIYVKNMTDKKGEQYSAYVKVNAEEGKLRFYSQNPDVAQKEGKAQLNPDNKHKTQVAVNNKGKKTEALENAKEPLKQGQTKPTEKQEEKERKPVKSKSRKI